MIKLMSRIKAKRDGAQRVLDGGESKGYKERERPLPAWVHNDKVKVMCPFCLHIDPIKSFLIPTTTSYHRGRCKCPECREGMRPSSLTEEWTAEEFAEWVWNYPNYAFWKKCSFDKFKERLYKIRWSYGFWGKYKELKKLYKPKSAEELYMEYQEDWAREQGYIEE